MSAFQEQLKSIKNEMDKEIKSNNINVEGGHTKDRMNNKLNNEVLDLKDIKRKEVLLVDLENSSVGSEQSGTRYCVVLQNDIGNKYSPTIIVAFVTSQMTKAKLPTHVSVKENEFGFVKDSVVLLEQIRTIDKKRIIARKGMVDESTMKLIDNALTVSVFELKAKSLLEKLPADMKQYVVATLKQIKKLEIAVIEMKEAEIEKDVINVIVNKKLSILNKFIKYCTDRQIDYKHFYIVNQGVNDEIVL